MEQQRIGDVLVTGAAPPVRPPEEWGRSRTGARIILRSDRPHASPLLLNLLKSAGVTWVGAKLRFGTVSDRREAGGQPRLP